MNTWHSHHGENERLSFIFIKFTTFISQSTFSFSIDLKNNCLCLHTYVRYFEYILSKFDALYNLSHSNYDI